MEVVCMVMNTAVAMTRQEFPLAPALIELVNQIN